ncbi:GNAT family N-acetyltransferase [Iodobacter sp. HSC-16F04]|uniref:GNAT family N-acetyltransferase n=1 Tax=Iodobacter violaceini TaxID=3044271 RepID=A0ABX0KNC1_9NEIS|nr:GNAT family protein [Iodobacter violacea]NHQ85898.1 GNAT family N-acetyltransferase [Iodobacter violacea]
MNIKLNTLTLRTFRPDDLAFVFSGLSNPVVIKHYGISYSTESACLEQMSWYQSIAEQGTGCWLAIESAGTPLGALGLNNICQEHKNAELGYWLLPQHWGKGIMQEALQGLLSYAFNELKLHRISAEVETENLKSQQLLQAFHFTLEGISRDCEIKEGKYISLMNYSLLSHELKNNRP